MSKTIKVSEAKQGKWYHDTGRVLFAFRDGQLIDYDGNIHQLPHFEVHPADRTGWDWEPEKPERRLVYIDDAKYIEHRPGDIDPDRAMALAQDLKSIREAMGKASYQTVFDLIDDLEQAE